MQKYTKHPFRPSHLYCERGTWMITASTRYKEHFFKGEQKLSLLQNVIFEQTQFYGWKLSAWSIFSNHFHLIAVANENSTPINKYMSAISRYSANLLNKLDDAQGRTVWYQYWETRLSFQKSYYARLNYVMNNPVKHGLVKSAEEYPWCSANWFKNSSTSSFQKMVTTFRTDKINVYDDY